MSCLPHRVPRIEIRRAGFEPRRGFRGTRGMVLPETGEDEPDGVDERGERREPLRRLLPGGSGGLRGALSPLSGPALPASRAHVERLGGSRRPGRRDLSASAPPPSPVPRRCRCPRLGVHDCPPDSARSARSVSWESSTSRRSRGSSVCLWGRSSPAFSTGSDGCAICSPTWIQAATPEDDRCTKILNARRSLRCSRGG